MSAEAVQPARVPLDTDVWCSGDGLPDRVRYRAVNVGEGGLFLRTEFPLEVGSRVTCEFLLPTGHLVRAETQVAWIRHGRTAQIPPPGMGLRFLSIPIEDLAALQEYVASFDEETLASLEAASQAAALPPPPPPPEGREEPAAAPPLPPVPPEPPADTSDEPAVPPPPASLEPDAEPTGTPCEPPAPDAKTAALAPPAEPTPAAEPDGPPEPGRPEAPMVGPEQDTIPEAPASKAVWLAPDAPESLPDAAATNLPDSEAPGDTDRGGPGRAMPLTRSDSEEEQPAEPDHVPEPESSDPPAPAPEIDFVDQASHNDAPADATWRIVLELAPDSFSWDPASGRLLLDPAPLPARLEGPDGNVGTVTLEFAGPQTALPPRENTQQVPADPAPREPGPPAPLSEPAQPAPAAAEAEAETSLSGQVLPSDPLAPETEQPEPAASHTKARFPTKILATVAACLVLAALGAGLVSWILPSGHRPEPKERARQRQPRPATAAKERPRPSLAAAPALPTARPRRASARPGTSPGRAALARPAAQPSPGAAAQPQTSRRKAQPRALARKSPRPTLQKATSPRARSKAQVRLALAVSGRPSKVLSYWIADPPGFVVDLAGVKPRLRPGRHKVSNPDVRFVKVARRRGRLRFIIYFTRKEIAPQARVRTTASGTYVVWPARTPARLTMR